MFRSLNSEGQSSSSPAGHGVTSPGLDAQESSWIGLLSVLSRPAVSFLQRYLPGLSRAPALPDAPAWGLKSSFAEEEREFLRQLEDMQQAAPHLSYLRCEHRGAAGLLEPEAGGALPWLTAESLQELGIQSAEDMDTQLGSRTFLSHMRLNLASPQEVKQMKSSWPAEGKSRTWWGSFWESSQRGSDLSWTEDGTLTGRLLSPLTKTTDVFVQSGVGRTVGENTGETRHKDEPTNNGGLHTVQNTEGSTQDQRLSIRDQLRRSEAAAGAAACSEVALPTPEQDNGYSSLEEEQVQMVQLFMVTNLREEEQQQQQQEEEEEEEEPEAEPDGADVEEETCEESSSGQVEEEEEDTQEEEEEAAAVLVAPQCQNKAIAFIMGCPCSDDDSSQSECSEDDDDGFDSEGLSDLSDSTDDEDDDDDEDSDSEADSEAERLWSSLCQRSLDPYNPQNFTARLQTSSTPPRTIPASSTPPSSTQSTPASSPDLTPLPLTSSSPPSGSDGWDDSTSASEADEAESLRLWTSFNCSSDPYSPFNFQAPLRTRGPTEAGPRARAKARKASQTPPLSPHHPPASPPRYRKEEAEERLDSGFSEPTAPSETCRTTKKVRFCDDVEEFFASCGEEEEDRRGPWEELARDRCRFLRRCQEVEQSIAYCLQPRHRQLVYQRLTVLYVQDD